MYNYMYIHVHAANDDVYQKIMQKLKFLGINTAIHVHVVPLLTEGSFSALSLIHSTRLSSSLQDMV